MKPYGWRKWEWRDEDWGPASRFTGGVTRSRRQQRTRLHKRGRRDAQKEIQAQLADIPLVDEHGELVSGGE